MEKEILQVQHAEEHSSDDVHENSATMHQQSETVAQDKRPLPDNHQVFNTVQHHLHICHHQPLR